MQDGTFDYKYSGSNNIDEVAWHKGNSGDQTHDVGIKKPNQLGLYDCSGNICEWCYDTTNSGYISEKIPYIYDETENDRRLRGGCWDIDDYKDNISISKRYSNSANSTITSVTLLSNYFKTVQISCGFRIVRTI